MSVSNGQTANSANFNAAFLSRLSNSDTVAIIDLLNTNPVSGSSIYNFQKELNKLNYFLGSATNTAKDTLPVWTSADVGAITDTVKLRADNISALFNDSTGHDHSGLPGEGAPISASSLLDMNQFSSAVQTTTFDSAVGTSVDVSTSFVGEVAGGGVSAIGVVTGGTYNKCSLFTKLQHDKIEKPTGEQIYGRLTESAGVWTMFFYYVDNLGVETAYNLPSQDIRIYFREVFTQATRPTFDDGMLIESLDFTLDIADASATQAGKVTVATQTFAGLKTFQDGLDTKTLAVQPLSLASGGVIAALANTHSLILFSGATTTEIQGVAATAKNQRIIILNAGTDDITLKHEDAGASAANRLKLLNDSDVTISPNMSAEIIYNLTTSRWYVASSGGGGGGVGYQESIGTGDGVTTSFGPLTYVPSTEDSIIVMLDGLAIDKSLWSLSISNIVFTGAPASSQDVYVWYLTGGALSPAPVVSGIQKAEYKTLDAGMIAAKQITLAQTPVSPSDVILDIIGGTAQEYSVDFTVSTNTLSWGSLTLDGLLSIGDRLRIIYVY